MYRSLVLTLSLLSSCTVIRAADLDAAQALRREIRFPKSGVAARVSDAAPIPLARGQWYVVDSEDELLVKWLTRDGAGSVTVSPKKGPLTIPAEMAPGREPDKDDPEVVTVKGPYVYIVKAKDAGAVYLEVLPKVNRTTTDSQGKVTLIPFTDADLIVKMLSVGGGVNPQPGPNPIPVDPVTPVPTSGPIAGDGFKVLIVYDRTVKLPAAQQSAVDGKLVRDYLKSHCVAERPPVQGDDGRAYRIWPAQEDSSGAPKVWQDAYARAAGKPIPWIIVSNGKDGFEGPLPATQEDTLALLKKYGGN